jgi:hypothetical protein
MVVVEEVLDLFVAFGEKSVRGFGGRCEREREEGERDTPEEIEAPADSVPNQIRRKTTIKGCEVTFIPDDVFGYSKGVSDSS